MIFNDFFDCYRPLLAKIARSHGVDPDDVPGLAWLAWAEAQASYRPDVGASLAAWCVRKFECFCRRERAQARYGLALDDTEAGCSVGEIAARAGVTPRRVNQIIAEMTKKKNFPADGSF